MTAVTQQYSTGPYNFVPFRTPVRINDCRWDTEGHVFEALTHMSQPLPGLHSGWIELTIRTLTPLHIGGSRSQDPHDAQSSLTWPGSDDLAWIPGDAIRGMARHNLEAILGNTYDFAALGMDRPIMDRQVVGNAQLPGVRVRREDYLDQRGNQSGCVGLLRWDSATGRYTVLGPFSANAVTGPSAEQAELLRSVGLTGAKFGRVAVRGTWLEEIADELHQVIGHDDEKVRFIPCSDMVTQVIDGFGTLLPRQTTSLRRITGGNQELSTFLRQGGVVPIFFDFDQDSTEGRTDERVIAFGFTPDIHVPGWGVAEMAPESVQQGPSDFNLRTVTAVDALFGTLRNTSVPQGQNVLAVPSRVSFGSAFSRLPDPASAFERALSVVLLSPMIKAHHMRLSTIDAGSPDAGIRVGGTYFRTSEDTAGVHYRGLEFYRHRWDADPPTTWELAVQEHQGADALDNPAVLRKIRPLRAGRCFTGSIRFTNLSTLELSLLTWALDPDSGMPNRPDIDSKDVLTEGPTHANHLGGLRPLGLGSVDIRARVLEDPLQAQLSQPAGHTRVASWQALTRDRRRGLNVDPSDLARVRLFHQRGSGIVADPELDSRLRRVAALLTWKGRPRRSETREMSASQHSRRWPLSE